MTSDTPGKLSLDQVLALQRDLYAGFADEDFQAKLEELEARLGKARVRYTREHTALFLTVQDRVLPRYGFEQGQRGVLKMLDDVSRFNGEPTFEQNRLELNQLLGLAPEEGPDAAGPAPGPRARA
eukprot:CAMPEP_0168410362 /NCGR_PEP_ID=MMETSP0228-20121227/27655_1 /TAXON_ID=133427 /ORGANISM="Protoceratium reticulatum, Strain CCCM 535 (=CCMP 1889)" /LENGTH=124 /DNA_ID=CAMNT_0008424093 /DNA_START=92 /DNA_END=462 /DNA_ORIENTATION=+